MQLWDTATLNEPAILETNTFAVSTAFAFWPDEQAPCPIPDCRQAVGRGRM